MPGAPDYYAVLGVSRDASPEEIRRAYRRLARECHPDVNRDDPEAEERFKQLTEAYRVLSDPQLRARYDTTGRVEPGAVDFGGAEPFEDLFDLMESFFGFGRPRERRRGTAARGNDVQVEVVITLREVLEGTTQRIRYERVVPCEDCDGTGSSSRTSPRVCPTCQGHGRVRYVQSYFFAEVSTAATCPECRGAGTIITDPCPRCRGRGVHPTVEEVEIDIPPGVDSGDALRFAGYGDFPPRPRGTPGDLIVRVVVEHPKHLRRSGADLETELTINPAQAALGDEVSVEGVEGVVKVNIPAGSQHGDVVVVRGRGLPQKGRRDRRGNLRVRLNVTVPRPRSRRERRLLEELREIWRQR